MSTSENKIMISKCAELLESKLNWGEINQWSGNDFEKLSNLIFDSTGTKLSVATLKRLLGRVKYTNKPTLTTLGAVSKFLGYKNWGNFVQINSIPLVPKQTKIDNSTPVFRKSIKPIFFSFSILLLILLFGFLNYDFSPSTTPQSSIKKELFSFSSNKVITEGIPNSVIFNYNASGSNLDDSIFIQQSWDKSLSHKVSRNDILHTSIYYYPGYFKAKLVVQNQIVKEHNLFIKTAGWLTMVEREKIPVYFPANEVIKGDGIMGLSENQILDKNIQLQPQVPWVSFFNVRQFEDLYSDDFSFETQIINDYREGSGICQFSEIHLLYEGGAVITPLSIKGCVSELSFYDSDGKKENPVALGVDFSDWVDVRVHFQGNTGKIYINHELAYTINYDFPPKKIVGVRYRFQGTGSVNSLSFSKGNGDILYSESF